MKIERLIVDVHEYGEPSINGVSVSKSLGIIESVGTLCPRDDAFNADPPELVDIACRAARSDKVRDVISADKVLDGSVVVVGVGRGAEITLDEVTAKAQNVHSRRTESQYRSSSNLRNPTARRFERHTAALSSSYIPLAKQAADKETPGVVTKLIGTLRERSL